MNSEKYKVIKNKEKPIQRVRFIIQSIFTMLCIWIGIEFYFFIKFLETSGLEGSIYRPPGVEGFLPISSLMSIYYLILTGDLHSVHPAGFFILIAILVLSFVYGKSFCSWLCPVGFLSELIGDFGEKFFKRRITLPKWLDIPLRSIKYLLLAFFVYIIFFIMDAFALKIFLDNPYNIISDIKMWYFFANISQFSLLVISILFLLSIVVRNFWCRNLCPYGALLGIFSLLSPNKIKRETSTCVDCNLCAKACPSRIKVDKLKYVISDECTSCLNCVDACPVADTLKVKSMITKKSMDKNYIAMGIVLIFMIITAIGMITGNWQNKITAEEYHHYFKNLENIGHPTSAQEVKNLGEK